MNRAVLALIPALLLAGAARGQEASQQQQDAPPVVEQEPPSAAVVFDPVASQLPPGAPDEVVTSDGNALTGEVKQLVGAQLKIKTVSTGDIYVKWERVRTVRTSRFFEVEMRDGRRLYGVIVGTEDGRLFVGSGDTFTEISRTAVVGITRIRQGFWQRLKGNASIGLGLSKASNQKDLTLAAGVRYRSRVASFQLDASSYVRRQDGAEDVNRSTLTGSFTRFLPNRWLVTGVASGEHNEELGLDARALAGGGAGYHLVRNIRNDLVVWGGLAVAYEAFIGDPDSLTSLEGVIAARYSFYLLSVTNTTINVGAALFPSVTESGRYRSQFSADLRHEFTTDLYLSLNGFHTYDSGTEGDAGGGDYGLSLGAGVTW